MFGSTLNKEEAMKSRVIVLVATAALAMPGATIAQTSIAPSPPAVLLADAGHAHGTPFGKAGDPKKVTRTIELKMTDQMRFEPAEIRVRRNETVRLVVVNAGQIKHEIQLGDRKSINAHIEEMRKNPEMEHDDDHAKTVQAGGRHELVWQFTQAGNFVYGCLMPGHYEQGMRGQIIVNP